jgi:hypothetical protein
MKIKDKFRAAQYNASILSLDLLYERSGKCEHCLSTLDDLAKELVWAAAKPCVHPTRDAMRRFELAPIQHEHPETPAQ